LACQKRQLFESCFFNIFALLLFFLKYFWENNRHELVSSWKLFCHYFEFRFQFKNARFKNFCSRFIINCSLKYLINLRKSIFFLPFLVDRETEEFEDGILSRVPVFVIGLILLPAEFRKFALSFGLILLIKVGEFSSIFAFFANKNLRTLVDKPLSKTIQALFK